MVGQMPKKALEITDTPVKVIAMETNYSDDAFYMAFRDKRPIPYGASQRIAQDSILGGIAVALQATGYYQLFGFDNGDRHIQSLIQKTRREDNHADEAIHEIQWMLLNKATAEDLTPEDVVVLKSAYIEMCHEINSFLNLLAGVEELYKLGMTNWLMTKEKKDTRRQADRPLVAM